MRIDQSVVLSLLFSLLANGTVCSVSHAARLDTEATTAAESRQNPAGNSGTIHLNFRDADLLQIINLMSELTGKNFLIDEKVKGKVSIVAPKPVTLEEAYQVFLSILEIQGFSVVQQGPIIKILPTQEVKERALPTAVDGQRAPSSVSDQYVTQLIPLQFADANELRALLTPLVSKQSNLLAYPATNTLILTDVSSNIARLLKIIRALDIESPGAVLKVIALKHAAPDQLAAALQAALEGLEQVGAGPDGSAAGAAGAEGAPAPRRPIPARQTGAPQRSAKSARIIPDPRTNSLVVVATPPDMAIAENLIARLDIPTPEGRGQIHVYYLAHANAEELARVLTAQVADSARSSQTRDVPPTTTAPPSTTTGTGTQPPLRRTTTGAPFTATTTTGVTITADKSTNSLVITAPPETYTVLKEIIQKLDIRRSQVLVESLIAEVTFSKARALGVEWRVIDEPNGVQVFGSSLGSSGATGTGVLNALTTNPLTASPTGLLIGALRNSITIGGNELFNIPAILRAFQGDSDVNILATPNLLTTDNEEAEIIIGEQRPFLRSAQDTPVGGVTGTSTIRNFDFKDTGITLRLTPQISQGKTVRLKLEQKVENFVSETDVGAVTTTKRSAKTTVIVDNAQTIVIGGLIQENLNEAQTQVPCLGNLPVLGWLFRQTSASKQKTNLLIFLTPHIITSPDDVNRITEHKRLQSDKAPLIEEQLRENRPQENVEILLN